MLATSQIIVLILAVLAAGWTWWTQQQSLPECEMTYCYSEYAQEDHAHLENKDNYTLQRFIHRSMTNQEWNPSYVRSKPADLTTPVLFIPGNRGSYMQGRSMASETGRHYDKVPRELLKAGLDWYNVDTKEQMSAFDSTALERQTEFVVSCMRFLKQRYRLKNSTQGGIVLVGHSMGGIVARMAMARAAQDPQLGSWLVSLLITESTPHQRPAIPAPPSLYRFYSRLAQMPPHPAPIISLAGGYNDTQVGSALTSLHGLTPEGQSFGASLEQVPGVWASSHHVCIVWCNQLVQKLASMLLRLTIDARYMTPGTGGLANFDATMSMAKSYLQASTWHQLMVPHLGGEPSAIGGAKALSASIDSSLGAECKGANLAWYRQYGGARVVKGDSFRLRYSNIKKKMNVTGLQYVWDLSSKPSSTGFMVLTSGTAPCDGFRLWVNYDDKGAAQRNAALTRAAEAAGAAAAKQAADEGQGGGQGHESGRSSDSADGAATGPAAIADQSVEVTHLAALLPLLRSEGRRVVRDFSKGQEVMAGIPYNNSASWGLHLPPHLLEGVIGITMWLGKGNFSTKTFQVSCQLYRREEASLKLQGINLAPALLGSPAAALATVMPSVQRPLAGPSIVKVYIDVLPASLDAALASLTRLVASLLPVSLLGGEAEADVATRLYNGVRSAVAGSGLWNILVLSVEKGSEERLSAKSSDSCHNPLLSILAEGEENTIANLTSFSLGPCSAGSASCEAVAVLDPACSYTLSVRIDLSTRLLSHMLLPHLSAIWSMAQVLLMGAIILLSARSAPAAGVWGLISASWQRGLAASLLAAVNSSLVLLVLPLALPATLDPNGDETGWFGLLHGRATWLGRVLGAGSPVTLAVQRVVLQVCGAGAVTLWLAALPLLAPLPSSSGLRMGGVEILFSTAITGLLLFMAGPPPLVGNSGPAAMNPMCMLLVLPAVAMLALLLLNTALHLVSLLWLLLTAPVRMLLGKSAAKAQDVNGAANGHASAVGALELLCMVLVIASTYVHVGLGAATATVLLTLASVGSGPSASATAEEQRAAQAHSTLQKLWLLLALLEAVVLAPSLCAWVIHSLPYREFRAPSELQDVALIVPVALLCVRLAFSKPGFKPSAALGGALRVLSRALLAATALGADPAGYYVQAAAAAVALLV